MCRFGHGYVNFNRRTMFTSILNQTLNSKNSIMASWQEGSKDFAWSETPGLRQLNLLLVSIRSQSRLMKTFAKQLLEYRKFIHFCFQCNFWAIKFDTFWFTPGLKETFVSSFFEKNFWNFIFAKCVQQNTVKYGFLRSPPKKTHSRPTYKNPPQTF